MVPVFAKNADELAVVAKNVVLVALPRVTLCARWYATEVVEWPRPVDAQQFDDVVENASPVVLQKFAEVVEKKLFCVFQ